MKNIVILRVDADGLTAASSERQIKYIKSFLVPSLKEQTCQDFKCFIEYLPSNEKELLGYQEELEKIGVPVQLVKKEGTQLKHDCWKERKIVQQIKDYILTLKLTEEDLIDFVLNPYGCVYSSNLIEYLKSYKATESEKVLLLNKIEEDSFQGFIYRCTKREYDTYFYMFHMIMGFKYSNFEDCPSKIVDGIQYKLLNEKFN